MPQSSNSGRRPRVLFVSYTSGRSGPTGSLLDLAERLRHRFDLAVALPGRGPFARALERRGIPVRSFRALDRRAIPGLFRLIRAEDFDLVYGNNQSSSSKNAFIAARVARVPFICHIREMSRNAGWQQRLVLRFADATIAVSRASARAVARYTGRRREPVVVHNGIEPGRWESDRERARAHLLKTFGLPEDVGVILSVGHLCPRKAQRRAVEAFRGVADELPSARLLLVGSLERDRGYVAGLERRIEELGLGGRAILSGERGDVATLAGGADAFVHTASADPHPRSVLEAMAAGLPVAAFAVDGVAETVIDGTTGYLVPSGEDDALAERLVRLLRDPRLRSELGRAGRRRVMREFTAAGTADGVARVIERVLDGRAADRPDRPDGADAVDRRERAESRDAATEATSSSGPQARSGYEMMGKKPSGRR